jgi:hypothetical protein
MRKIILAVAATLAAAPAAAQQAQQVTPDDRVVVQGRRAEDAVRDFVAEVGAAPTGTNMARWDRKVCVGAFNLAPEYAQRLVDQVSLVAVAVGLEPGEPGCRSNVLIMADPDGDALAARLVKDHLRIFQPPESFDNNLGSDALRRFQTSDAPVRWWHVGQTVLADTGLPVTRGMSVRVRGASRLRSNVRQDMSHVLIILDASRIGSVSFTSLADYVSMVALAQIDPEADTHEFSSVLNLFANEAGERRTRMTQWDLDYLIGLYETSGDAATPRQEANRIARKMLDQDSAAAPDAGH